MRGRAVDREREKDGGRASGVEDVPRASSWVPRRHVPPGPEGTSGPTGKSRLPYFFLFWELSVSGVEASSGSIELFKCSDCRVIRVFLFFSHYYCLL